MSSGTDWLSAIGVLLSGVVVGFMFFYAQTRRKSAAPVAPVADLELLELEAKRDALVQQLREMEDAGAVSDEERIRLEGQTATVLRAIDVRRAGSKVSAPGISSDPIPRAGEHQAAAAKRRFSSNPVVVGFLWGVGSVVAIALLGYFVYRSSTEKNESGNTPTTAPASVGATPSPQSAEGTDAALVRLQQAVANDPDNVDRRIELARAYMERQNMMAVFEQSKAVLDRHPDEPRALTYNAIVKMAMGQADEALVMLDRATRANPKLVDAWVAIAWIQTQRGNRTKGEAAIETAIRNEPSSESQLREVWAKMSAQPQKPQTPGFESPRAAASGSSSLPPGHPSLDASSPAPAPSAGALGAPIHVTLTLDPTARSRTGILFLVARAAGQSSGMPIAVKRLTVGSFPLEVDISSADSMTGQTLPSTVSIEARLDSDGDAMTKAPTDPRAFADGVPAGTKLTLVLK